MEKLFMKGNEAIAEAAVRAGCRFFAGYPITPQNEIPEYLSRRLPEVGGVFIQGESEVASINMVAGAAFTGTRAMSSSSGPGLSLKSEGLSYMAAAELPAVVVNVMRGGPGIGTIQAGQMDYLQATKASGHGGFRMIVFAPGNVQEAVDLMYQAFDKAFQYRGPMLLALDGSIGSIMELVELPEMKEVERADLHFTAEKTLNARNVNRKVVSSCIPVYDDMESFNKKCADMYAGWQDTEVQVEEYMIEDAEYVFVAYGTTARVVKSAIHELRHQGHRVGLIRPITLYPFPSGSLRKLNGEQVKKVYSVELSRPAQMVEDVLAALEGRIPVLTQCRSGGNLFTEEDIIDHFLKTK